MYRTMIVLAGLLLLAAGVARAESWPPKAPDLAVSVLPASAHCLEGEDCRYLIRIANEGSAVFEGKVKLLHITSVPGVPANTSMCQKRDFNSFTCETGVKLEPNAAADFAVAIRMLATPLAEAEHCARLMQPESDPVSANDQNCVKVLIAMAAAPPECPSGQDLVNGQCRDLAKLCTGGRDWTGASQSCACPADRPVFDRAARGCAVSLAAAQCSGGRTAFDGGCYCPAAKPVWDSAAATCRVELAPAPVIAAVPVAKPKPVVVDKPKLEAAIVVKAKKAVPARPVRHRAKAIIHRKAVRVAAAPQPKCPHLWRLTPRGYCFPVFWVDPDTFLKPLRR